MNLVYNFTVAHKLGAGQFGHASAIYTVLMLLSSVTLSFQLLCSKFVARSDSESERIAIYNLLHRRSWLGGLGVGVVLLSASSAISHYLNLPSPLLVRVLAIGTVFYVPLGTRRGFMQGTYDFIPLALNFSLEAVVKLVGAVVLMSAGYSVRRRGGRDLGVLDCGVLCRHSAQTSLGQSAADDAARRHGGRRSGGDLLHRPGDHQQPGHRPGQAFLRRHASRSLRCSRADRQSRLHALLVGGEQHVPILGGRALE